MRRKINIQLSRRENLHAILHEEELKVQQDSQTHKSRNTKILEEII